MIMNCLRKVLVILTRTITSCLTNLVAIFQHKNLKKLILVGLVISLFFWSFNPLPLLALNVENGQQVKLKARRIDLGIPLHRESFPSMFDRVEDGALATVLDTANDKSWLKIETENGKNGWIVERYVAQVLNQPIPNPPPVPPEENEGNTVTQVWTSATACDAVVSNGDLLSRSDTDTLRLASWNIRWFPDGQPNSGNSDKKTALDWLACTIAWMDVDALAVQEIKTTNGARNAWDKVTQKLKDYTGDDWEVILNSCGNPNSQHLGFLYNEDKLKVGDRQEVWQYNGRAESASNACQDNLRPGYLAYFESLIDNGFDFYAVSIHSDSGRRDKDLNTRQTAIERIDDVTADLANIDGDFVILGDFNTMGIEDGISAKEEIRELKDKVATEVPGFNLLAVQPSCTHYYKKKPGWLDHVLVSADTTELITAKASVQGYCALNNCDSISGSLPKAAISLSDHCPIVVDFQNADLD